MTEWFKRLSNERRKKAKQAEKYKKNFDKVKITIDICLFVLAITSMGIAAWMDVVGMCILKDSLSPRIGGIAVIIAAFIEIRTSGYTVQKKEMDNQMKTQLWLISLIWNILHGGQDRGLSENGRGTSEGLKDMLYYDFPPSYYKWNSAIKISGIIIMVAGTIIWAFGDLFIISECSRRLNYAE